MTTRDRVERQARDGLYLVVAVAALLLTLYLALQLIGFLVKLLFFVAVVVVGLAAWRAWRASS
jgi:hypothetical protein